MFLHKIGTRNEETMPVPVAITLEACLPLPVVAVITALLFSFCFYFYKNAASFLSALVSIGLVVISSLLVILIPLDVFLVSSLKESDGNKKDWANNATAQHMEISLTYGYYGAYSMMLIFIFLLSPFTYFSHLPSSEETSQLNVNSIRGIKFASLAFLILCLFLVVGGIIPLSEAEDVDNFLNDQINYISKVSCIQKTLEQSLLFAMNCLNIVGLSCFIIYTAFGMSVLPINLIKGKPKAMVQRRNMDASLDELQQKINDLTSQNSNDRPLSEVERRQLEMFSRQLMELQSKSDSMRHQSYSCLRQCDWLLEIITATFGVVLFLVSLLIVVSIIISNTNRLISSLGLHTGYLVNRTTVYNPMDKLLLESHKAYPLDYLVLGGIVCYFIVSSFSGMQHMGIWFLWMKIHILRTRRSTVQALLCGAFILSLIIVYSSVLAYSLAPQYVTYGVQMYKDQFGKTVECSSFAPADQCIMTRLMAFQSRFFQQLWVFGAIYYWGLWLFVLVFIIGSIVSLFRARKTVAQLILRDYGERTESTEQLLEVT